MNKPFAPMTHRQRILAALNHQPVDRFPTDIWAVPEVWQKLYAHFNTNDPMKVFEHLNIDGIIGIAPEYIGPPAKKEADYYEDEWGMGYSRQAYGSGEYFEQTYYPLAKAETIQDLQNFAWPSPDWYDYSGLRSAAAKYPDRAIMCGYSAVFYYHNKLRGLEKSFMDPLLMPEFTRYLLDRIMDFFLEYHRRCFEAASDVIDLTQVTDDFGSQTNLLISLKTFDAFYRAHLQSAIDLAKTYNIKVFHHDDGDIRKLLPRLTEMGINILNPIQWRCGEWDLNWLKNEYGEKLCFHGGIDNQHTLPFGSPEDVKSEVRRIKSSLGKNGTGLIIGPCHNIQANTSIENILALYSTANEVD